MLTRIISGVIAAAAIAAILLLPPYVLAIAALLASFVGIFELSKAFSQKGIHIDIAVSWIASVVILGKAYGATLPNKLFPGLSQFFSKIFAMEYMNAIFFLLIVYLFCKIIFSNGRCRIEDMAYTLFAIVYIPFLLSFAVMTRNLDRGVEFIWLIPIGSAITDSFAYFSGVAFGKTKIIPHISPKKTVEGSIGGAFSCMLFMMLYGWIFVNRTGFTPIPLYHFAFLGLLCGVVSQLGDWGASAIKRSTGIKDFGRLIPGHGGIMDRADSVLFVAPIIYIYTSLFLY